ncbi:interferon-inducible GTPase 5-like [Notolabrus celidotus]|uniref:interferon-inducible GTPase 5-like n=1 Tax=Notolabrus celidotus TaxID=1203425 RepID=UPI0014900870|nr:interferon-inducible GTPase 5-like [Notolabrus celidotus]
MDVIVAAEELVQCPALLSSASTSGLQELAVMDQPESLETMELMREITEAMNKSPAEGAAKIQECLEKEKNTPLNIAITGESGSGKSTFVNALRGVDNRDERAAPTGCNETTMEVTPYPHPIFPNVTFCDLPGIGTMNYPTAEYLKKVGFEKFDFFIIVSADRFRENDVKLAKEIQKMEKKFYFVRSKIDDNLRAEERSTRDFNAGRTLGGIRENCIQGLQDQGFESPQVFLVSSFDLKLYDFKQLQETLQRELPEHKKDVFLLAMPNISQGIIEKKKKVLQSKLKYYGLISAGIASAPVPGLSIVADLSMLVNAAVMFQATLCLDSESLQNLALSTGVPLGDLRAVMTSPLAATQINKELIIKVLSMSAAELALMAAEEGSRFIPLLGIPVAMTLSFTSTYSALHTFLNMLADDAQRVFKKALGLNTAV